MNSLKQVINNSPVIVHAEKYAVAQLARASLPERPFAVFIDDDEVTAVVTEKQLANCSVLQVEQPFAMFEFRVSTPFEAPGFLATICTQLAAHAINVLVYSTFSRDYVLLPWKDVDEAASLLRQTGFTVERRSVP